MKMPALFVGHGSPMLALEDNSLTRKLGEIGRYITDKYGNPKGIVLISAHWYTRGNFTNDQENPKQIYDMYGFPKELYELKYKAKGSRELANRLVEIRDGNIEINNDWGIDHGSWSILVHLFPKANIPIVQLSVNNDEEVKKIYEIGKSIEKLRDEGYLVLGSGNIVHNLRLVDWRLDSGSQQADDFDEYIKRAVTSRDDEAVLNYSENENASYAVPTEDHFLPLIYILGASREKPSVFNNVRTLGSISMTSYIFE